MDRKWLYWIAGAAAVLVLLVSMTSPARRNPVRSPLIPISETRLKPEVAKLKSEPSISFYSHATNQKSNIKLERYLEGVIAGEIGGSYPSEALKAQAIVARSMTLAKIQYTGGTKDLHGTDACDLPEHFQAYKPDQITPSIRKAVQETRGQIAVYNGKFAYTNFHSYAGPKTADISESFPSLASIAGPYTKVVDSPGARYAPANEKNWQTTVSKSELESIFGSGADISALKIANRGPSGRVLDFTAGDKTVKGYDLRTKLGPDKMKSTLITEMKVEGDQVVFKGEGWGHGAGMAQWGAYEMAKDGKTAAQIISHYYPGTRLVDQWR